MMVLGAYKLFRQWDLLELHLVDSCGCGAQHRGESQDKITFHDDNDSNEKQCGNQVSF